MVYTSSNVRAMSKTHQMSTKQSANENLAAGKIRSPSSNMHFQPRRNVALPQEQHPVAQNSRQKAPPQQQQYYQYHHQHQQQQHQSAGQRQYTRDGSSSRQLMSLPAKAPIDGDHGNRHNSKNMATNDGNGSSDNSIADEYSSDDDLRYNNNRSILNHHNCQPTGDIYMDALSEVRIKNRKT